MGLVNKNGIPVKQHNKGPRRRKPLTYSIETVILWKIVDGARKEIEVANFDPVIKTLKRNRWKLVPWT